MYLIPVPSAIKKGLALSSGAREITSCVDNFFTGFSGMQVVALLFFYPGNPVSRDEMNPSKRNFKVGFDALDIHVSLEENVYTSDVGILFEP